jgi:hypothetical protein
MSGLLLQQISKQNVQIGGNFLIASIYVLPYNILKNRHLVRWNITSFMNQVSLHFEGLFYKVVDINFNC